MQPAAQVRFVSIAPPSRKGGKFACDHFSVREALIVAEGLAAALEYACTAAYVDALEAEAEELAASERPTETPFTL